MHPAPSPTPPPPGPHLLLADDLGYIDCSMATNDLGYSFITTPFQCAFIVIGEHPSLMCSNLCTSPGCMTIITTNESR